MFGNVHDIYDPSFSSEDSLRFSDHEKVLAFLEKDFVADQSRTEVSNVSLKTDISEL